MVLSLCLFLVSVFGAAAQGPLAEPATNLQNDPRATLTDFYGWYLAAMAKDRVPMRDDRGTMESFVTAPLLQDIERRSKGVGGLDEDYFTHAQDYFDDWIANIAVSELRMAGTTASAIVTLGASQESRHRLAVQLVKEGSRWKIWRVAAGPGNQ